ncbi:MAG: hypothetical protein GC201_09120 [Alphaproteobacteria bacterium]|nr:hypothetical protein [Alphaproteobacteria bacterium]
MRARDGGAGGRIAAHALLAPFIAASAYLAWRVGYPDLCSLMGVYLLVAVMLYEVMGRVTERRAGRAFGRTGKVYAVVWGLAAIYVASDAYVQERAWHAYPASGEWFGILFGAIIVLGSVLLVRRSGATAADDIFVSRPRFTGLGVGLFVTLVSLQLIAMTALLPWGAMAVLYRIAFCAAALWTARFGMVLQERAVAAIGFGFLWLGIMTAYLDLLWPYRTTWPFLAGAVVLGVATAVYLGRKAVGRTTGVTP